MKRSVQLGCVLAAFVAVVPLSGCGNGSGDQSNADSGAGGTAGTGGSGGTGGKGDDGPLCAHAEVGWPCGSGMVCDERQQCVEGCFIAGKLRPIGAKNPDNACESCVKRTEPGWAPAAVGSTCGAGRVCSSDNKCVEGCYIANTLYEVGATNPSNVCEVCSAQSETDWSANVGVSCGEGTVCNASGQCVSGCFVNGTVYEEGAKNPSNACEVCSGANTNGWTAVSTGSTCGSGMYCGDSNQCVTGCSIGAELFRLGDENPSNDCEVCSATNPTGWSAKAMGASCKQGGGNICNTKAQCVHQQRIACGAYHTCAVTSAGALKCWGANYYGEIGVGALDTQLKAKDVPGLSHDVVSISAGPHTCALTSAGAVKCWGINNVGQLGDNSLADKWIPTDVYGLSQDVVAISAGGMRDGEGQTCAIVAGGGLMCWGHNEYGQLGIYSTTNSQIPQSVPDLSHDVLGVAAGAYHTCAVQAGAAKCWGYNYWSILGDGSTTDKNAPIQVSGLVSDVSAIVAGYSHSCALESGGSIKCWGIGSSGQLGSGTTDSHVTPSSVLGLPPGSVAAMAVGGSHTCVITSSGGVMCWGSNQFGQLGDGSKTTRLSPIEVANLSSGVVALCAGGNHTCAIKDPDLALCWGHGEDGKLGDGTGQDRLIPTKVVDFP